MSPSNSARTDIERMATRVEAAFHRDRHRGSTPLGSTLSLGTPLVHTTRDKPIAISPGDSTAGSSHTNWKAIIDAGSNSDTSSQSREVVARRYWPVVNAFVKRSGIPYAETEDVTQGFIADVMLGRNLLAAATPSRGRFRSLLQASVRNYCIDELRKRTAASRAPEKRLEFHLLEGAEPEAPTGDPDRAFTTAWAAMLIEQAAADVRERTMNQNQEAYWDVFDRRVLGPALTGAAPVSTEAFMRQWSLSSPVQVANIVARMKRRFTAALMAQLGHFDDDSDAVIAEVSSLLAAIGGSSR